MTGKVRARVAMAAVASAFLLAAATPAGANRLCVANIDPDNAHRFLWMHTGYDYAIHEAAVPAAGSACFDSEFLIGPGWYVKGIVQLYDDRYQTAGDEVFSKTVDMGPADSARRADLCFEFDRAAVSYVFRAEDCP